jgi:hypothetical protein
MLAVLRGERRWIECPGACAMPLYSSSLGGMKVGFGSCLLDKGSVVIGVLGCWIADCRLLRGTYYGHCSWSEIMDKS